MEPYKTSVRPITMNIPVYMAYVVEEKAKIVKGGLNCILHLGSIGGDRPQDVYEKDIPSPTWGVLESHKLVLPDKTGLPHRLVYSGYVSQYASFVGSSDYEIIKKTEDVLISFVRDLRELGESRIPILFATEEEALGFLEDKDNFQLAKNATEHYDKALEVEMRTRDVPNNPSQRVKTLEFGNPAVSPTPQLQQETAKGPSINIQSHSTGKDKKNSGGKGITEIPGIPS